MSTNLGSGAPDPSFANNGILVFTVPSGFKGHSKAFHDGSFISIGSTATNGVVDSIVILRHDINGMLIGSPTVLQLFPGTAFDLLNMVVRADGSVVIFGAMGTGDSVLFARVSPDNVIDPEFGANGFTIFPLEGRVLSARRDRTGMVARDDGSIAVAAELDVGGGQMNGGVLLSIGIHGVPESQFGSNGATYSEGGMSFQGLAVRSGEQLLVVGGYQNGGLVALYSRGGILDKTYDRYGNGFVLVDGTGAFRVELMAIAENNKEGITTVAGYLMKGSMGSPYLPVLPLVAQLKDDGSLNKNFNNGRSLELANDPSNFARGLALQTDSQAGEDEKILVWLAQPTSRLGALLMLDETGKPDDNFGPDGRLSVNLGPDVVQNGIEWLPNGKAVVYGSSTEGSTGTIARFLTR